MELLGYRLTMDISADYHDEEQFDVDRILEFKGRPEELAINVIAVKAGVTPTEDTKRYDFGLCQIWFDGEKVHTTPAYHADKDGQVLTLIRMETERGIERSMRRYERLKAKYPWPCMRVQPAIPHDASVFERLATA